MPDPAAWDWGGMARTALSAGLATAAVQLLVPLFRDRRDTTRQARYLALRLAVGFEEFGTACYERNVENNHAERPPDEQYPNWNPSPPDLPAVPDDNVGWLALNALDASLANRAITFRSKTAAASAAVSFCLRFYEDELAEVMEVQISECGIEAATLARDLRKKFGLGKLEAAWDWLGELETTRDKARSRQQQHREQNAALSAALTQAFERQSDA